MPLLGIGQVDGADTVIHQMVIPVDTVKNLPFRINGLRVGVDLQPWIRSISNGDRDLYNFHMRLDAGPGDQVRYGALLDLTSYQANLSGDSATYYHKGTAARLGLYYNVLPGDPEYNLVTVGIGYGRSWFDESLSGIVDDEGFYGPFAISRTSTGLRAGWFELSGGMQARVWQQLFVGYNLTLKLLPHYRDDEQVQIYEIPGFGKASEKSAFSFNYYLLYRFSFGKN